MDEIDIEFSYKGIKTTLQSKLIDKFIDIMQILSTKLDLNLNSVNFLYSGKEIKEIEKTIMEISNDSDKEKKKMNIQINDKSPEEKNNNKISKSKLVICPECGENCLIELHNNKIRLYDCINDHDIDGISLHDFENTQLIDESTIKCQICQNNKANSYNNIFFICNTCKINLCPLCKDQHDKYHYIIDYEDKNSICPKHDRIYISYCKYCKQNLCSSCEAGHNMHEIISFEQMKNNEDN